MVEIFSKLLRKNDSKSVKTALFFTFFCIFLTFFGAFDCFAQEYSYVDLINRLIDLPNLAVLPQPGEMCKQASSYDRRSTYDEKTGKYINWDVNGDGYGRVNWLRKENGRLVLAEITGPGCIFRFWVATAFAGRISIYVDGELAVDLPCKDFFNCTQEPFNRPNLVHVASEGKNCYIPIPFQKSCKIIADKDYGQYYQFVYTMFPQGTKVPTFKRQLSSEESAALDNVDKKIAAVGPNFNSTGTDSKTIEKTITLKPGEKKIIADIAGTRAITSIVVKDVFPKDVEKQRQIVRELVLTACWDGQEEPAVWSPLGDFFGTAPGLNKHNSLPVGITNDCLYSNWFMPFENGAKLELANDGQTEITIPLQITHCAVSDIAKYGRFHAKWHKDAFLPTEPERWIDWTILKTQGIGRFCGVSLEVWNPRGGWWGEGDEKFFVDGEKFPSTFGTGSEDYFGYAWCCDRLFNHAFHNQPLNENNNKGHISNSRWHISDNIPFQKSFEGTIEKYFANSRPTQYSCVAYWYLSPGGKDEYKPLPLNERIGWYSQLQYPLDVAGILVLKIPQGVVEAQGMDYFKTDKWKNNDQLWWIGELGAKLEIGIETAKTGDYRIFTRMTKAADYAIVQWYLDGQKIYEPIDLYNAEGVIATKQINLGKFNLTKGRHRLQVEIVGANPAAIKRYMVGIDYVKIK